MRLRLDVEYDGGGFHGWAEQPGQRTVAGVLTGALATVLRVPPDALAVVVAGRTDAGVHASGQVCHVDVPQEADVPEGPAGALDGLARRLRGLLPPDVRLRSVAGAPPGFDARFSALRREYHYLICDDPAGVPPLRRHDVVGHRARLDVPLMHEAAQRLRGLHDFAAFCKARRDPRGETSTVRTLEDYTWSRTADGLVRAEVAADAFCHSMVRALVGCLLAVGDGRRGPDWPGEVLERRVRDPGVTVAPAHGLCLVHVRYPGPDGLSARAAQTRAVRVLPGPGPAAGPGNG